MATFAEPAALVGSTPSTHPFPVAAVGFQHSVVRGVDRMAREGMPAGIGPVGRSLAVSVR